MTKSDAIKKIEELQAYIEGLDTNWEPNTGEKYWCVDYRGEVKLMGNNYLAYDHWNIKSGNCFGTKEEAENYKMRLIAMKPKYLPKEGGQYWTLVNPGTRSLTWDNDFTDKTRYYSGMTFKTEKEAQEWLDTYGKYFERRPMPNTPKLLEDVEKRFERFELEFIEKREETRNKFGGVNIYRKLKIEKDISDVLNWYENEITTLKAQVRKEIEELRAADGTNGKLNVYLDSDGFWQMTNHKYHNQAINDCLSIASLKEASNE